MSMSSNSKWFGAVLALLVIVGPTTSLFAQPFWDSYAVRFDNPGVHDSAIEDLDQDGDVDWVVAGSDSRVVTYFGGDWPDVENIQEFVITGDPLRVAIGDLDGDDFGDLIILSESFLGADRLLLYRGLGENGFEAWSEMDLVGDPTEIGIADLDDDGAADIVVAGDDIQVYLGAGDGTFAAAVVTDLGSTIELFETGDFDEDGRQDLIVVTGSFSIQYLRSTGGGELAPPVEVSETGTQPSVVDYNGDGHLDVVHPHFPHLRLRAGAGDGTFTTEALSLPLPTVSLNLSNLLLGDLDQNGLVDFVGSRGSIWRTHHRDDSGAIYIVQEHELPDGDRHLGDFNGDGSLDILVAGRPLAVIPNDGTDRWLIAEEFTLPFPYLSSSSGTVSALDMNGDGHLDFIRTGGLGGLGIALGDGTGGSEVVFDDDEPTGSIAGDFDSDGNLDLLGFFSIPSDCPPFLVEIGVRLGTGTSVGPTITSPAMTGRPRGIMVGDADGDGALDLAMLYGHPVVSLYVFAGGGDGTFVLANSYALPEPPRDAAMGDFDGDGNLDVALTLVDGLDVRLGDGSLGFPSVVETAAVGEWGRMTPHDFDSDGRTDLAVSSWDPPSIAVFRGTGTGGMAVLTSIPAPQVNFARPFLFDIDQDSELDLLIGGSFGIQALLGLGGGLFDSDTHTFGAGDSHLWPLAVVDVEGDGRLDLIVHRTGSGSGGRAALLHNVGDCNANDRSDWLDHFVDGAPDCDGDGVLDECAIVDDPTLDLDGNGIVDACGVPYRNGDCDGNGTFQVADAVCQLSILFGPTSSACPASLDIDGDGQLTPSDPIHFLAFLFTGGAPPSPPYPNCATGPPVSAALGCTDAPGCP